MGFDDVGGDYRLYWVQDGAEALGFIRRTGPYVNAPKPNLVLPNLNLLRMTGFDVLQAISDDPTIEDVPTVVFSSSGLDRHKVKCLALGARAFVTKPNELDEFLNVLRHICSLVQFRVTQRAPPVRSSQAIRQISSIAINTLSVSFHCSTSV